MLGIYASGEFTRIEFFYHGDFGRRVTRYARALHTETAGTAVHRIISGNYPRTAWVLSD